MILGIGAAVYAILFFLMRKDILGKGAKGIRVSAFLAVIISMVCWVVNSAILGNTDLCSTTNYRITDYDPVNFPALVVIFLGTFIGLTASTVEMVNKRKADNRRMLKEIEKLDKDELNNR